MKNPTTFIKFNVQWGYNNIRIKDGDEWKAAFITHKGLFEPTVMFFGLCNSPATFQRFMNESFRDMIAEGWLVVYMDDLLISSPDLETDTQRTTRVLQRMKELDLHLKIKKCKFGVSQIDYLGMVLSPGQIKMDQTKLNGIKQWPIPKTVKIGNYSNIARPLIDLTKKNKPWNWNDTCQNVFKQIKNMFMKEPVLQLPDSPNPTPRL